MQVGDIIEVEVTRAEEGFALVKYQGVESTLMQTEITYDVDAPVSVEKHVQLGEKINVKVIAINGNRYSISLKQIHKDPLIDSISIGDKYQSEISQVTEYGYFVNIEPYCRGLLLKENATSEYKVGEMIKVSVLDLNIQKRTVLLNEL